MEFINLKRQYQEMKSDIDRSIQNVLNNTNFIMGNEVEKFEEELAQYVGVKYCISCSDGTAALQLIYMAYNIGTGDAVFCPDMTFIASIEPVCMLGATPVFCDIDSVTYNIDPTSLRKQIEAVLLEGKLKPRAIVAVDFLGNPASFKELRALADQYGLLLIEDAAQAMGAQYYGKMCGSLGDVAATSFFPTKPLGCYGDGGAVFTNDLGFAEIIRSLRVHGKGKTKYDNLRIGINSRLDTIQASILHVKLKYLAREIEERQQIAKNYDTNLRERLVVPKVEDGCISAFAQYILKASSGEERKQIIDGLKETGIPTILYYPNTLSHLPVFCDMSKYSDTCDDAYNYSQTAFGIPFYPYLSLSEQENIINNIIRMV